eukprot:jgi/Psemu1/25290/gm1.25290_g
MTMTMHEVERQRYTMESNDEFDEGVVVEVKRTHSTRHREKPTTNTNPFGSEEITAPIQSSPNGMNSNDYVYDLAAFGNTTTTTAHGGFNDTTAANVNVNANVNAMLPGNSTSGGMNNRSGIPNNDCNYEYAASTSTSDMVLTFLCPVFLLIFCTICGRPNIPSSDYHRGALFRRQAERVWAIQRAKQEREDIPVEKRKVQIEESLRKMKVVSKCPETGQCILAPEEEQGDPSTQTQNADSDDDDDDVGVGVGVDVGVDVDVEQGNGLVSEEARAGAESTPTEEIDSPNGRSTCTAEESSSFSLSLSPPSAPSSEIAPGSDDTTPTKAKACPGSPRGAGAERRPLLSSDSEDSGDSTGSPRTEKEEEPAMPPPDAYNGNSNGNSDCYDFDDDEDVCPICLDNFEVGDVVMWSRHGQGACSHAFHEDCLLQWLLEQRENECPTCRACFIGDTTTTTSSTSTASVSSAAVNDTDTDTAEHEYEDESDGNETSDDSPSSGDSIGGEGDIEEGNGNGRIDNNVDSDQEEENTDEAEAEARSEQGTHLTDRGQQNDENDTEIEDALDGNFTYVIVKGSHSKKFREPDASHYASEFWLSGPVSIERLSSTKKLSTYRFAASRLRLQSVVKQRQCCPTEWDVNRDAIRFSSGEDDKNVQSEKYCDGAGESTPAAGTDAPSTPPAGSNVGNFEPDVLCSEPSLPKKEDDSADAKASDKGSAASVKKDKIYSPHTYDVLFGRGRPLQKHPGNLRFHKIVNKARDTYIHARKEEKIGIARKVMDEIKTSKKKSDASNSSDQPKSTDADDGGEGVDSPSSGGEPGRFLKKVGEANASGMDTYWEEVTEEVAIEKISHALRGRPRSGTRSRIDVNGGAGGTKSSSSEKSGNSSSTNTGKSKRKGPPSPPTNETTSTPVVLENEITGDSDPSNVESSLQTLAQEIHLSGSGTPELPSTSRIVKNKSQAAVGLLSLKKQQQQALLIASQLQQLRPVQPSQQQLLQQVLVQQHSQQLIPPSSIGAGSTTSEGTQSSQQQLLQQLLNQQQPQLFGQTGIGTGTSASETSQPGQQQLLQQLVNITGTESAILGQGQQQLMNTGVRDSFAAQQLQIQLIRQQQQIQQLLRHQQQQMQSQLLQDPQMQQILQPMLQQQQLQQNPQPGHAHAQQQLQPLALQQHPIDANVVRAASAIQSATQHASGGAGMTGSAAAENHNNITEALLIGASALLAAQQTRDQNQASQLSPRSAAATLQQPNAALAPTTSASGPHQQLQQQSRHLLLSLLLQQQPLSMLSPPQNQPSSSQRQPPPGGPSPSGTLSPMKCIHTFLMLGNEANVLQGTQDGLEDMQYCMPGYSTTILAWLPTEHWLTNVLTPGRTLNALHVMSDEYSGTQTRNDTGALFVAWIEFQPLIGATATLLDWMANLHAKEKTREGLKPLKEDDSNTTAGDLTLPSHSLPSPNSRNLINISGNERKAYFALYSQAYESTNVQLLVEVKRAFLQSSTYSGDTKHYSFDKHKRKRYNSTEFLLRHNSFPSKDQFVTNFCHSLLDPRLDIAVQLLVLNEGGTMYNNFNKAVAHFTQTLVVKKIQAIHKGGQRNVSAFKGKQGNKRNNNGNPSPGSNNGNTGNKKQNTSNTPTYTGSLEGKFYPWEIWITMSSAQKAQVKSAGSSKKGLAVTYILVFGQVLYFGNKLQHSLICPNQVRDSNSNKVEDIPRRYDSSSTHRITLCSDSDAKLFIPLQVDGVISYCNSRKPSTKKELADCKHVVATDTTCTWDPYASHFAENKDATNASFPRVVAALSGCWPARDDTMICYSIIHLDAIGIEYDTQQLRHQRLGCTSMEASTQLISALAGSTGDHKENLPSSENLPTFQLSDSSTKPSLSPLSNAELAIQQEVKQDVLNQELSLDKISHICCGQWGTPIRIPGKVNRFDSEAIAKMWKISKKRTKASIKFKVPSIIWNDMAAQVFANGKGYVAFYPVRGEVRCHDSLSCFVNEVGIPEHLVTGGAKAQVPLLVAEYSRAQPGGLRRAIHWMTSNKGSPRRCWTFCGMIAADCMNLKALDDPSAMGRTHFELVHGYTPGITLHMIHNWYDFIWWYNMSGKTNRLGQWLGPCGDTFGCGDCHYVLFTIGKAHITNITQAISKDKWQHPDILSQLVEEHNKAINAKTGDKLKPSDTYLENELGEPPLGLIDGKYEDEDEVLTVEPEVLSPDVDSLTDRDLDEYLGSEVSLQIGDQHIQGLVKNRCRDANGVLVGERNNNALLDSRSYKVSMPDGSIKIYTANMLANSIYSSVDDEGWMYCLLDKIINFEKDEEALTIAQATYTTKSRQTRTKPTTKGWEDGSKSWAKLSDMKKESFPVETALYVWEHSLINELTFKWWAYQILQNKDQIISGTKTKYWTKSHKYGVPLPKSIAEAKATDLEMGTNHWARNAYLTTPIKVKYYTIATKEQGFSKELCERPRKIVRALYRFPVTGTSFWSHLASHLREFGYVSCKANPDVHLRSAFKKDGMAYYKYCVALVDDMLFKLKDGTIEEPSFYLRADIGKTYKWDTYTSKAIKSVDEELSTGKYAAKYRPEIDASPEMDAEKQNYYQGLIGIVLRWI